MNKLEHILYFFIFLLNKYLDLSITDKWLNNFENKIINKYLSNNYKINNAIKPIPIPTINANELTDEKFKKLSNNYRNPILIKEYLKKSEAVKVWNLEYLEDKLGDFKINTMRYDNKLELEYMSFKDFVKNKDKNIYINNNHTIFSKFPKLYNDIKSNFVNLINTLTSSNLKNIHVANLFIGYNNPNKLSTGSSLHCGGSGNFFCMIHGKKHWILIDPKYSCLLKGRVAKSGIHGQTLFEMGDKKDLSKLPEIYQYLPRYDVILEPGDILWNAPWWWHRIKNEEGLSIGVAIRNNKVTKLNFLNNMTYTLAGYIYLLYNSITIGLYEKILNRDDNFGASKEETKKDNVLYQIEQLIEKYPKSCELNNIL